MPCSTVQAVINPGTGERSIIIDMGIRRCRERCNISEDCIVVSTHRIPMPEETTPNICIEVTQHHELTSIQILHYVHILMKV